MTSGRYRVILTRFNLGEIGCVRSSLGRFDTVEEAYIAGREEVPEYNPVWRPVIMNGAIVGTGLNPQCCDYFSVVDVEEWEHV